ncbi:AraC family transcriptional regulator [Lacihabitans sp. LS3-19]|uniref:AraC family transcriptional regulator n=1 Tax=Lacihabitans sp. LS3-19 TaxID=2487335 RepID=UPI0020CF8037|nr:AraC family transcriptional regulator [Lacihabitans sp. LS3-19]
MPLSRVRKWIKKFEKYIFSYKDGYFVLPYLTNSPELMIESLINLPFTKHNSSENAIYTNTPFTEGVLRYQEVESGLWLTVTELEFKTNVQTKSMYDNLGSDYFFLAFSIYQNTIIPKQKMKINNALVASNSWSIYSPGIPIDAFHEKGTKGLFFNFSFNKNWIENNLIGRNDPSEVLIQKIIDSELGYLSWEGLVPEAEEYALNIWHCLSRNPDLIFSKLQLKIQTLEILTLFFTKIYQKTILNSSQVQNNSNHESLSKIEEYLSQNLKGNFPGIDFLANMAHMSPSKLKTSFKASYGTSIFKYFKEKQMELAIKLLKDPEIQIKNLSTIFGYENPSKFSIAFKKIHGKLPSEIQRGTSIF